MSFNQQISQNLENISHRNIDLIHIDYRDDCNLLELLHEVCSRELPHDLHIVSNDALSTVQKLKLNKMLPEITFVQLENIKLNQWPELKNLGVSPAIQIRSDIEKYKKIIVNAEYALLMITTPGVSGGSFDLAVFDFIKQVRDLNAHLKIYVDGGVSDEQFKKLKYEGVHTSVIGSFLSNQEQYLENLGGLVLSVKRNSTLASLATDKNACPICETRKLTDIIRISNKHRTNFVLIFERDEFVGIITDGDIKRALLDQKHKTRLEDITISVRNNFISMEPSASVHDLTKILKIEPRLGAIPLCGKDGAFNGAVFIRDLV